MIDLPFVGQDILWNAERIGIAFILALSIGWESEQETHTAGVRTFPIVAMASCGYILLLGNHAASADQSRLLQGLITGIGFIGGGAILKDGATVTGTATAASVWNAGVIGAAVAMDGRMIDRPVILRAEDIVRDAQRARRSDSGS